MPTVGAKADTAAVGIDIWFGFSWVADPRVPSSYMKIRNNLKLGRGGIKKLFLSEILRKGGGGGESDGN